MKTTLDLPDSLVKQVELRASTEGRKVNEVAADLLRIGLASGPVAAGAHGAPVMKIDPRTQLPYFECGAPAPAGGMTVDQLIELERDSQTREDLERLGLPPGQ